jgi:hypothetical protein
MSFSSALGVPGRNLLPFRSGTGASIIGNGADSKFMPIGATIDWSLFSAAGSDTTLIDGELIRAGWRFARFGQVLTRVTGNAPYLVTVSGSPTGGTFTVTVTVGGQADTTAAIAYNATPLVVSSAIQALLNVGAGNVRVTGNVGGPYGLTFPSTLGTVTVSASGAGLTGGTSPSAAAATPGSPENVGWFGPYDPNATDGRQNLNRGDVGIVERTIVMGGSLQLPLRDDLHSPLLIGGTVWPAKLIVAGTGTASLAAGPQTSALLAVLPELKFLPPV